MKEKNKVTGASMSNEKKNYERTSTPYPTNKNLLPITRELRRV